MDLLLILTYAAFAYGVFRIFKIPVNGFTMLTAVLGGAALIGALLLGMNYNHPYTSEARFYFNTTPIIPAVSGVVTEVPVQGNTMLKAGDVLFRIDPAPFENAVKAKEAALAAAVQTTHQLRATADAAQKKLESALADRDGAKDVFERSKKLHATGAIAQAQLERDKNNFNAAEATAQSAKSEADRALLEAEAVVQGVNTDVARLQAELDTAKFNLEQSVVRAPTDGTVQQNFLRPGMYAASMPLRPVMVFLHNENRNSRPRFCKTAPSGSSKDRRPNSFCPPCRVDFSKARSLWVAPISLKANSNPVATSWIRNKSRGRDASSSRSSPKTISQNI